MSMAKTTANADIALPLPHNLDAERNVLGAILLSNAALLGARELLQPEDFFLDQHKHIFYKMLELHDQNSAIDLVLLTEELQTAGELEIAGGAPYISALADGMPKVTNIEHYARIVKEKATLRNLIYATSKIQQDAFAGEDGSSAILDGAKSAITALIQDQPHAGLVSIKSVVHESFAHIEKIFTEGRHVTGLSTGYSELDRLLAGLQPSDLIVLAARPAAGKSSLALNIAENVTMRTRAPAAFFSLEMSRESLLLRMLASHARIDAHKFRTGHLSKEDMRRVMDGLGNISPIPLWIDDSSTATVGEISARAERVQREHGLSLVIVDYLQLVTSSRRFSNRQEEVSDVSRGLKALAKDLKVPVLALSQLRRPPDREERMPQLSDLRESGAIEQDADVVLFIHRPNLYKKDANEEERNKADVVIGKQRNGPTDIIHFVFLARYTRFEEAAPEFFPESQP